MANTISAIVLGYEHSKGISKSSDKPYDYAVLNYLGKNDGWTKSEKGSCSRLGLEQKKIALCNTNPTLFAELAKLEGQFPIKLDLVLDTDPNNIQKNWVVDFKLQKSQ